MCMRYNNNRGVSGVYSGEEKGDKQLILMQSPLYVYSIAKYSH